MIKKQYFQESIISHDNQTLVLHHWPIKQPKVLIHLIHGMSEHMAIDMMNLGNG